MSTLRVNSLLNAAGTATPAIDGLAKAWVNFNGQGTVAIRAAFNVSSITDNGTGQYTVNLTTAMPDANYGIAYNSNFGNDMGGWDTLGAAWAFSASAVKVTVGYPGGQRDNATVCVSIFR